MVLADDREAGAIAGTRTSSGFVAISSAQTRFVAHKQAQVDRIDASINAVRSQSSAEARFLQHKERQVEALDWVATSMGAPDQVAAPARFVAHKHAQIERIDASAIFPGTLLDDARARFVAYKRAQVEQIDA